MRPRARATAALAALLLGGAAAGCGSGERQDADEPEGEFRLEVTEAAFPRSQSLAEQATLSVEVRNTGSEAVSNLAMTVETRPRENRSEAPVAFGQKASDDSLADAGRPIWIIDRGPGGGDSAYTNTWALGRLAAGRTRRFEWRVTPIRPGAYTLAYRVAPELDATRSRLARGGRTQGSFRVRISDEPGDVRITEDGEIVRE
jgi:hypothetical protein